MGITVLEDGLLNVVSKVIELYKQWLQINSIQTVEGERERLEGSLLD